MKYSSIVITLVLSSVLVVQGVEDVNLNQGKKPLDKTSAKILAGIELKAIDGQSFTPAEIEVFSEVMRRLGRGELSSDEATCVARIIRRAVYQKRSEVLQKVEDLVRDRGNNPDVRESYVTDLMLTADIRYLGIFKDVAINTNEKERMRCFALQSIAFLGAKDSEAILRDFTSRNQGSYLGKISSELVPIAAQMAIARDTSLDWNKRREVIQSLTTNYSFSIIEAAVTSITRADPEHADEIKALKQKGEEIFLQNLKDERTIFP